MSETPDLFENLTAAAAGREAGMAEALEHAEAVEPGWGARAYDLLIAYANAVRRPFTTLELRHWVLETYGFAGVTNWAWGAVVARAHRAGVIRRAGDRNIGDATSHLKLSPTWELAAP